MMPMMEATLDDIVSNEREKVSRKNKHTNRFEQMERRDRQREREREK
jgi:hypothetical protein